MGENLRPAIRMTAVYASPKRAPTPDYVKDLPVPEYDVGERNGYRFTPWRTLNGEKASCPFD